MKKYVLTRQDQRVGAKGKGSSVVSAGALMVFISIRKTVRTIVISLVMGTIKCSERYHVAGDEDLIYMAYPVFMVEIVDFLFSHASAIPLTA